VDLIEFAIGYEVPQLPCLDAHEFHCKFACDRVLLADPGADLLGGRSPFLNRCGRRRRLAVQVDPAIDLGLKFLALCRGVKSGYALGFVLLPGQQIHVLLQAPWLATGAANYFLEIVFVW
jgi:hypothetical protein